MDELKSKDEKTKEKRRFSQDQYDMLKCCSDKKDMTEWNEWRKNNPDEDIWLQGGDFKGWSLRDAYLDSGYFYGGKGLSHSFTGKVHLEGADLREAHLENTIFQQAHLEDSNFSEAHIEKTHLYQAHLENAYLISAYLEGADFIEAHLEGVYLIGANLEGALFLHFANLKGADLAGANIKRAKFHSANLQDANFHMAIVDGETLIWDSKVNKHNSKNKGTDFSGVELDSIRIDPATKQLLEYNIRRKNWEDWYPKQNRLLRWIVSAFWWVSNYGISAPRIIKVFLFSTVAFAIFYYLWGIISPPGIVDYLFVDKDGVGVAWWLVPIRAIHFSVVIMTVGFTNMHANAHNLWAHILVSLQMILGFVLLGALVTRFAVLFTAGGPAGKFADEKSISDRLRQLRTRMKGKDVKRT